MKKTMILSYFVFSLSFFIFGLYLFYLQATRQIASDLWHLDFINPILSGELKLPHEGFEYTVYALSKLLNSTYLTASIIFLSITLMMIAYIKFYLVKRLSNIPAHSAFIFSLSLMFVSAICLPSFNSNLYMGQGSPTIWHNPTLLCVKPFAFLCLYLAMIALRSSNRKIWGILSILLIASFLYKPSFGIVFIPALFLYILCIRPKNYQVYLYFLLMILPSLLFTLTVQLQNWLFLPEKNNSIIFSPFGVLHLYTSNSFFSFILATSFPFFFMIFNPKRVFSNPYLTLSWLMLIIGYLQFAFLAETECFKCANFSWGFSVALDCLFVFTFIEFISWMKNIQLDLKRTSIIPGFLIILFLTHLISGVGYLGRYIMTGNFM